MEEDALSADAAQTLVPNEVDAGATLAPTDPPADPGESAGAAPAADTLAVADDPVARATQVAANPSEPVASALNQTPAPPAEVSEAVPSVPVGEPVVPAAEPTIAPVTTAPESAPDALAVVNDPIATVAEVAADPSEPVTGGLNQTPELPAAVSEVVPTVPAGEPVAAAVEPVIAPVTTATESAADTLAVADDPVATVTTATEPAADALAVADDPVATVTTATEPAAEALAVADDPVATVTEAATSPAVEPVTRAAAPAHEAVGDPIAPVTGSATKTVAETTGSGAGAGSSLPNGAENAPAVESPMQTPIDEGTVFAIPASDPSTHLFVEPAPTPPLALNGVDPAGLSSTSSFDSTVASIAPTSPPLDASNAVASPDEGFIASALDALGSASQVISNTSPTYAAAVAALAAAGAAAARFGPSALTAVQFSALPHHLSWRSPFSLPRCEPAAAFVARPTSAGLVSNPGGVLGATAFPPTSEAPEPELGTTIPEAAGIAPDFIPPLAGDDLRSGSLSIALTAMAAVFLAIASLPARAYSSGIRAVRIGSADLIAEYRLWAAALGFALLASAAFAILAG